MGLIVLSFREGEKMEFQKVLSDISQGNIYLWRHLLFKANTSSLDKPERP